MDEPIDLAAGFRVQGLFNRLCVLFTGRTPAVIAERAPVVVRTTAHGCSLDFDTLATTRDERFRPRPTLYAEWPEREAGDPA